jgi:hypothetical protein
MFELAPPPGDVFRKVAVTVARPEYADAVSLSAYSLSAAAAGSVMVKATEANMHADVVRRILIATPSSE